MASKTEAPEELDQVGMEALSVWCQDRFPWLVRDLRDLVQACLDHHGARGNKMANWRRCCQTWVRKHDEFHPELGNRWKRHKKQDVEDAELKAEIAEIRQSGKRATRATSSEPRRKSDGPLSDGLHDILKEAHRQLPGDDDPF